jgi:hypothetical protein
LPIFAPHFKNNCLTHEKLRDSIHFESRFV